MSFIFIKVFDLFVYQDFDLTGFACEQFVLRRVRDRDLLFVVYLTGTSRDYPFIPTAQRVYTDFGGGVVKHACDAAQS